MMLWKILYSPYDLAGLIVMVIGLSLHALADYSRSRRARGGG